MSTMILSVKSRVADVATAFILISTGVVLLLPQATSTMSDVNSNVFTPPVVYCETV